MDPSLPVDHPTPSGEILQIVAACIERLEAGEKGALDEACRRHPQHAETIRRHVAAVREQGLLGPPLDSESVPQRLGEFRILRKLGGGGMGVVYLAEQESLGRKVALKLIRGGHLFFPGARARFRREAEAAARLQHPGIVRVHAVGEDQGLPYLVQELVAGCTLAEVLAELHGRDPEQLTGRDLAAAVAVRTPADTGPLMLAPGSAVFAGSWENACLHLARETAEALDHAHRRGVIHRDIKPSNLMITPAGQVLLLDFGLAHAEEESRLTGPGSQLGSLAYMPPEQLRGEVERTDARSDLYSLGVTLYELLCLQAAYLIPSSSEATRARIMEARPASLRRLNPRLSWEAETVCLTAMDPDPARRYATAADFARDLGNVVARRPIEARRPSAWLRARRFVQRHPAGAAAGVLAALLLVGVPTGYLVQQNAALARITEERNAAKEESARAEANFDLALQAVDRLLFRVSSEKVREVPGLEQLERRLIEDALEFYRGFLSERGTDPRVRRESGRAWRRAGELQTLLGESAEAERSLLEAIRVLEPPSNGPVETGQALELARAHQSLAGNWGRLGRREQAAGELEAAHAVLDRVVEATAEVRSCRGEIQLNEGLLLHNWGRFEQADRAYAAAITELEAAAPHTPVEARIPERLAEALMGRAELLRLLGDAAAAMPLLERGIALVEQQRAGAALSYELRIALVVAYVQQGETLLAMKRVDEGLARLRLGTEELERFAADYPRNTDVRRLMVRGQRKLAEALRGSGDSEGALSAGLRSVEVGEELVAAVPEDEDACRELASACRSLAQTQEARGDAAGAAATLARGIVRLRSLVAAAEPQPEARRLLGVSQKQLAIVFVDLERLEEAQAQALESVRVLEELAAEYPGLGLTQEELAQALEVLGVTQEFRGELEAAESSYRRGIDLFLPLVVAVGPEQARRLGNTAGLYNRLCLLLRKAGRLDQSLEAAEAAIRHQQAAAELLPQNRVANQRLWDNRQEKVRCLAWLGREQEAAAAAEEFLDSTAQPWSSWRNIAVAFASCAFTMSQAPEIPGMTAAERERAIASYSGRAVEALREAIAAGAPDPTGMLAEPEFGLLSERADFQALLRQAGAPD